MMVNKKHIHIGIFATFTFLFVSCAYSFQNRAIADAANLHVVDEYTVAS